MKVELHQLLKLPKVVAKDTENAILYQRILQSELLAHIIPMLAKTH